MNTFVCDSRRFAFLSPNVKKYTDVMFVRGAEHPYGEHMWLSLS